MKANDYFKLEAISAVVQLVVLYMLVQVLVSRFDVEIEILWSIVILIAGSDIASVVLIYLLWDRK